LEGYQIEMGFINWTQNTVQTVIIDANNSFHCLDIKLFPRLGIQRDSFIIIIFGEVRTAI